MTFGEKLQMLRTKAGLSQEELASRLDVSRQAVSKWELNKTMPDVTYIVAVSDLFSVTTDYLLKDGVLKTAVPDEPTEETGLPERSADAPGRSFRAAAPAAESCDLFRRSRLMLLSGSAAALAVELLYLALYCFSFDFRGIRTPAFVVMGAVLIGLPVLLVISRCLPGRNIPGGAGLTEYRRLFALCAALWGFAVAVLCGFQEVVDDLLVSQVSGLFSIPVFLAILALLGAVLYGAGLLLANVLTRNGTK